LSVVEEDGADRLVPIGGEDGAVVVVVVVVAAVVAVVPVVVVFSDGGIPVKADIQFENILLDPTTAVLVVTVLLLDGAVVLRLLF
jgi:hypothetical protein